MHRRLAVFTFVSLVIAASAFADETDHLSVEQQKDLQQWQLAIEALPVQRRLDAKSVQAARSALRNLFAGDHAPASNSTDALTATLCGAINGDAGRVNSSVQLVEQMVLMLNRSAINDQDLRSFTNHIDPLVQNMRLPPSEKLRLYREALLVLQSAPSYRPH